MNSQSILRCMAFVTTALLASHGSFALAEGPTVYLVRHADRDDGNGDLPINSAGLKRAVDLERLLCRVGQVQIVFTTEWLRTQQTAAFVLLAPTSQTEPEQPTKPRHLIVAAKNIDQLSSKLKELTGFDENQIVLVVHHSDLIPHLIEALTDKNQEISRSIGKHEFNRIFVFGKSSGRFKMEETTYENLSKRLKDVKCASDLPPAK